jgi:DNA-binding Lrp family transcriptional regulator
MPPLHIKLGLIKQFVTKLNPESRAFKHIQELFPKLSEAKVKAGVFVGPQVKQLINYESFPEKLSKVKRAAWTSFVAVVSSFLGNHKAANYGELIAKNLCQHTREWVAECR